MNRKSGLSFEQRKEGNLITVPSRIDFTAKGADVESVLNSVTVNSKWQWRCGGVFGWPRVSSWWTLKLRSTMTITTPTRKLMTTYQQVIFVTKETNFITSLNRFPSLDGFRLKLNALTNWVSQRNQKVSRRRRRRRRLQTRFPIVSATIFYNYFIVLGVNLVSERDWESYFCHIYFNMKTVRWLMNPALMRVPMSLWKTYVHTYP